jgi:hypothetical protein
LAVIALSYIFSWAKYVPSMHLMDLPCLPFSAVSTDPKQQDCVKFNNTLTACWCTVTVNSTSMQHDLIFKCFSPTISLRIVFPLVVFKSSQQRSSGDMHLAPSEFWATVLHPSVSAKKLFFRSRNHDVHHVYQIHASHRPTLRASKSRRLSCHFRPSLPWACKSCSQPRHACTCRSQLWHQEEC